MADELGRHPLLFLGRRGGGGVHRRAQDGLVV
jgi:hypothetical protein